MKVAAFINHHWRSVWLFTSVIFVANVVLQNHYYYVLFYRKANSDANFINKEDLVFLIGIVVIVIWLIAVGFIKYAHLKAKVDADQTVFNNDMRTVRKVTSYLSSTFALVILISISSLYFMLKSTMPISFAAHYVSSNGACNSDYYIASSGDCVHLPSSNPSGATAQCRNGQYTYSEHRSGSCSQEGGVARWIN